jgi:hypothetical protein
VYANFHEKAPFLKADVAALEIVAERNCFECPSRYASIRTRGELTLFFLVARCIM